MKLETYEIKLPQFEGPFDLLLFFIERDELDIYDIPISKLTQDFLEYIHKMQMLNIELASEFILVAATLMRIKAKMLIPRKELDELGNQIDPRQELTERLLEYKKYKAASAALIRMEEERYMMHRRGNLLKEVELITNEFSGEMELQSLTLYKLMRAFEAIMRRKQITDIKVVHEVVQYEFSLEIQSDYLRQRFATKDTLSFVELYDEIKNKTQAIYTFLAMLELIQSHVLSIYSGLGVNNFWITKCTESDNIETFMEKGAYDY